MDWITLISNFLRAIPIISQLFTLVYRFLQMVDSWIKRKLNPSQKKIKFHQQEILVLNREHLMQIETNLIPRPSIDKVIVRSDRPFETIDYNFAKRVYTNMAKKQINYEYFFYYGNNLRETIEYALKIIQTISVVKLFTTENQQIDYDNKLGWQANSTDQHRLEVMNQNFTIPGFQGTVNVASVVTDNLTTIISQRMSMYFIAQIASERFCIHDGANKRDCYLSWCENDIFIKLTQSDADRKIQAYDFDKRNAQRQGIFWIDLNTHNNIDQVKNMFNNQLRSIIPPVLHSDFQQVCLGAIS